MTLLNERYLDILLHDAALAAAWVLHHDEGVDTSLLRQRLQRWKSQRIKIHRLSYRFSIDF
jgi:hypothetical protein